MKCELTENEVEYLISAMVHLSNKQEAFLQQQHDTDSSELYTKLVNQLPFYAKE